MRRILATSIFSLLLSVVVGCSGAPASPPAPATARPATATSAASSNFQIISNAFKSGETIPSRFTCNGDNVSPELSWSGQPQNTVDFALIVDDPDAPRGVFTHWLLFDLPGSTQELKEGVPTSETMDNGAIQGNNDGGRIGYTGPCPPQGPPHRYRFTLYALNSSLDLKAGASKQQLLDAMQNRTLGQAQLVGTYQRAAR